MKKLIFFLASAIMLISFVFASMDNSALKPMPPNNLVYESEKNADYLGENLGDQYCGDSYLSNGEECDNGNENGVRCNNDRRDCEYCSKSCKMISLEEEENHYVKKRSIFINDNMGVFCNPNWECTGWNDCDGGVQTRKCRDTNNCEYPLNKPIEKTSCDSIRNYVLTSEESVEEKYYSIPFGLLILIAVLLLFILVFVVNWRHLGGR